MIYTITVVTSGIVDVEPKDGGYNVDIKWLPQPMVTGVSLRAMQGQATEAKDSDKEAALACVMAVVQAALDRLQNRTGEGAAPNVPMAQA